MAREVAGAAPTPPDVGATGEPGAKGFLTSGLAAPEPHYYTRLFVDAARALPCLRRSPQLAGRPLVSTGVSQGGGVALAAAHLHGGVAAVAADVPFLCNFRRAVTVTDSTPYAEISDYCRLYPERVDQVFATLSYFDAVNHARRLAGAGAVQRRPRRPGHARRRRCSRRSTTTPATRRSRSTSSTATTAPAAVHFERKVAFVRGLPS